MDWEVLSGAGELALHSTFLFPLVLVLLAPTLPAPAVSHQGSHSPSHGSNFNNKIFLFLMGHFFTLPSGY